MPRLVVISLWVFFVKQKTAYEMRISDWSSDVCSSDLLTEVLGFDRAMADMGKEVDADLAAAVLEEAGRMCADRLHPLNRHGDEEGSRLVDGLEIGRASCRERVCQYV